MAYGLKSGTWRVRCSPSALGSLEFQGLGPAVRVVELSVGMGALGGRWGICKSKGRGLLGQSPKFKSLGLQCLGFV